VGETPFAQESIREAQQPVMKTVGGAEKGGRRRWQVNAVVPRSTQAGGGFLRTQESVDYSLPGTGVPLTYRLFGGPSKLFQQEGALPLEPPMRLPLFTTFPALAMRTCPSVSASFPALGNQLLSQGFHILSGACQSHLT
jgi:hypothetical protein